MNMFFLALPCSSDISFHILAGSKQEHDLVADLVKKIQFTATDKSSWEDLNLADYDVQGSN